ncbi:hypothetical protein CRG98_037617 [Punica granatum]|uniref:Retrotransposon gag domain-containing protein n=1 Tax=Punica granatum TaxID=22663 RepID=A0A2I0IDF0_PUNGR|nr:hypothetical protein CRG98_037617 [Punica granatum]
MTAPEAPPTYATPAVETEQERWIKRVEEMMRAIQESSWFTSLNAADFPTWEELAKKFVSHYGYNIVVAPSLLELSVMEMTEGQSFEDYATHWCAVAAKHRPPIDETKQIQIFHGTLKGAYYSHLLGHTSSFSDMIKVGKKALSFESSLANTRGPRPADSAERQRFHMGAPGHTMNNYYILRDKLQEMIEKNQLPFNEVKPPNVQNNSLPDHESSSNPTVNIIDVYTRGKDEAQDEESATS